MNLNTLSINKILKIFEDFARRSKMLNGFGFGTTDQIGASKDMKYPLMWVFLPRAEITDNNTCETFHFQIFFMDRLMQGETNYTETISDMNYVYRTLIGEMMRHPYWDELELSLVNASSDTVISVLNDNTQGWVLNISMLQPIRISYCNSPIESPYTIEGCPAYLDEFILDCSEMA